jgi:hypothetical protein
VYKTYGQKGSERGYAFSTTTEQATRKQAAEERNLILSEKGPGNQPAWNSAVTVFPSGKVVFQPRTSTVS